VCAGTLVHYERRVMDRVVRPCRARVLVETLVREVAAVEGVEVADL